MPFLIRPGIKVETPSQRLGDLLRDMWAKSVARAKSDHEISRKGYPPAHVRMTEEELVAWKAEEFPEVEGVEEQDIWQDGADEITLIIHAIDGKTWDEYQMRLHEGIEETSAIERVVAKRRAYRFMVERAVDKIAGLEDEQGPYVIARGPDGKLTPDDVAALERGGWLKAIAQVAATYQTLTDGERGNYGGRRLSTSPSPDTNAISALSAHGSVRDATGSEVPNFGAGSPTIAIKPGGAQPSTL